jgi:hypothetical protein
MNKIEAWVRQVTTGHGVAVLGPTLLAVGTGQMTWLQALPLLVGGIALVLWPENTALQVAVKATVTDVEAVAAAYKAGMAQAATVVVTASPAPIPAPLGAAGASTAAIPVGSVGQAASPAP